MRPEPTDTHSILRRGKIATSQFGPAAGASVVPSETSTTFTWGFGGGIVTFSYGADHPVVLSQVGEAGFEPELTATSQPMVEVVCGGEGRARANTRFTNSGVGARLRYISHTSSEEGPNSRLEVNQKDPATGIEVTTIFASASKSVAFRVQTLVRNAGSKRVVLEAVSSLALGSLVSPNEDTLDMDLLRGRSEQLAEFRWSTTPIWGQSGLAQFNCLLHAKPGRGSISAVSQSTWSTGSDLPMGAVTNRRTGRTFMWQIEHNGAWRWEIDDLRRGEDSLALILLGPELLDHQWAQVLEPGAEFWSVPVSVAYSTTGFEDAVKQLTFHRRAFRVEFPQANSSALVFNDFMNTINGDPTTEKVLPLVPAAAEVGAEVFCVDAGWYDDTDLRQWWPFVGDWLPSTKRFPGDGLGKIAREVRAQGMAFGLWLEPEVVGVESEAASSLPKEAFMCRYGERVCEQQRLFLDLRHPSAREHLDQTFDRLIEQFGVEYFKLDYNVTPGPGTDLYATSIGAGLLDAGRAYLAWFESLRRRYPTVVFENCASGAMRCDYAQLSLFDLQSTSDQVKSRVVV